MRYIAVITIATIVFASIMFFGFPHNSIGMHRIELPENMILIVDGREAISVRGGRPVEMCYECGEVLTANHRCGFPKTSAPIVQAKAEVQHQVNLKHGPQWGFEHLEK